MLFLQNNTNQMIFFFLVIYIKRFHVRLDPFVHCPQIRKGLYRSNAAPRDKCPNVEAHYVSTARRFAAQTQEKYGQRKTPYSDIFT